MNLKLERPLVVFDIESTGLNTRSDRIIELSAVRIEPDGTRTTKTWLLNPGVPIPADATAIHGYGDDDVKDAPRFEDKASDIIEFFKGADLGGFNCDRFDIPCLVEEFARTGRIFNVKGRKLVDAQKIFHRKEPRDLSAAVRFYLGREHVGAHGATADAEATFEVLEKQLEKYEDLPRTVDELDKLLNPDQSMNIGHNATFKWVNGELLVNFGRKKGQRLRDLVKNEPSFLRWIIKGDFAPEARILCQDLLDGKPFPSAPKSE